MMGIKTCRYGSSSGRAPHSASSSLTFEERLAFMLDREITYRKNKRLQRFLRAAKFRHQACVEDIDYPFPPGLDKSQFISLTPCQWITQKYNVIFEGPTGGAKNRLACALGLQACGHMLSMRYFRLPHLLEALRIIVIASYLSFSFLIFFSESR
ncbi:MAG: IstB domain protein ATP-binding protein [Gammaproteobacteria bacterium]|jgi:DNA replication protein DnaC|nr:IstB domain protein ATP-binding protein [Gammaproteobacteria bacterium]